MPTYQVLEQYLPCINIPLGELKALIAAGIVSEAEKINCPQVDFVVA